MGILRGLAARCSHVPVPRLGGRGIEPESWRILQWRSIEFRLNESQKNSSLFPRSRKSRGFFRSAAPIRRSECQRCLRLSRWRSTGQGLQQLGALAVHRFHTATQTSSFFTCRSRQLTGLGQFITQLHQLAIDLRHGLLVAQCLVAGMTHITFSCGLDVGQLLPHHFELVGRGLTQGIEFGTQAFGGVAALGQFSSMGLCSGTASFFGCGQTFVQLGEFDRLGLQLLLGFSQLGGQRFDLSLGRI